MRGAHMSRLRVELRGIRGRGRSSNHSGDDGGNQTGTRSEVQWMSGWEPNAGSKTRNANMIQKVDGPRENCHGSSWNYDRQTIKAGEWSNNYEGRSHSGGNTSKWSNVTQRKPEKPQKMRSSRDAWVDQPKASSSKRVGSAERTAQMQISYLRWLHRRGIVRQETGERVMYSFEMQRQNRKSTKTNKSIYRDQLTVE